MWIILLLLIIGKKRKCNSSSESDDGEVMGSKSQRTSSEQTKHGHPEMDNPNYQRERQSQLEQVREATRKRQVVHQSLFEQELPSRYDVEMMSDLARNGEIIILLK